MKAKKRVLLSMVVAKHRGRTLQYDAYCAPEDFPYRGCGFISATRTRFEGKPVYQIGFVHVIQDFQRGKIATRLYEILAREACRRSTGVISRFRIKGSSSTKFWRKQVKKGRARQFIFKDGNKTHRGFLLKCPLTTLEGINRKECSRFRRD